MFKNPTQENAEKSNEGAEKKGSYMKKAVIVREKQRPTFAGRGRPKGPKGEKGDESRIRRRGVLGRPVE